jgi:hypothetical protein
LIERVFKGGRIMVKFREELMGYIKIVVPSEKIKEDMIAESRYLEYELPGIDSDRAGILMHLYNLPDECWVIEEEH